MKLEQIKLPIEDFRLEIIEALENNSVVIITAETGAGKSTQVPQFLLGEGYNIVVTQPRRLAARSVAERVAYEYGCELGETVGFRVAGEGPSNRMESSSTRCLFCTDGLALVRELMGAGNHHVLVLDEVHEWNENMEVLVSWAKSQVESGNKNFKVVLMSATLEAEKLSAFFNGAPVIKVPGRMFPVEVKTAGKSLIDDTVQLLRQGHNVLVFQPGKQEIEETISDLKQMNVSAEILPLHGQLTPDEQKACFRSYSRPKCIVSTNVAQTSVTIPDIDAVIDSGMERRVELVDGVEGLYLKPISKADSTQRKGRAGRTKVGIYIDHCDCIVRSEFPVAEIMRKRLDQTVLRLAIAGFNMEAMEFFHQPKRLDIASAHQSLIGLGCMTKDGKVTKIGHVINRLPISVQFGRMLVEADRLNVINDVLTVAAIMEVGGIVVPPPSRNRPDRADWRLMVPDEKSSDIMGQLKVWELANSMSKDEMFEGGIAIRQFFRAKEIRRNLANAIGHFFQFGSTNRREDILKAVCAGMVDHLYKNEYGSYRNGDEVLRSLGTSSLVRDTQWMVGKPFDLEISTRSGPVVLKLVEMASKIDPSWLVEIAPQLVTVENGINPVYDFEQDVCTSITRTMFNGQKIMEDRISDPDHKEASLKFSEWLANQMV
jgi:HrpA-like RNA helicase